VSGAEKWSGEYGESGYAQNGIGIAHHRPRAVINLAFFASRSFDDRRASGVAAPRILHTNCLTLW